MRVTVLGGNGGFPSPAGACGGFLLEHEGVRLLVDPGYATFPQLVRHVAAEQVDAVFVTHGHPDHCADLSPLLRARVLGTGTAPTLPLYAPTGALDAVLALDPPGTGLAAGYSLAPLHPAAPGRIGPFSVRSFPLPHFVPSVGLRFSVGDETVSYTGDTGPSPALEPLADRADLLVCEATYIQEVPAERSFAQFSADLAGKLAARAGARRLLLTHVWPGTDPDALEHAARQRYDGPVATAEIGLVVDLSRRVEGHQPF